MTLHQDDFRFIRELVCQYSGVILHEDKGYLAEARLASLAPSLGFPTLESFVQALRHTPFNDEHIQAVEAVTTHETSFFRDRAMFEGLRRVVIPQLVRHQGREKVVRIWCGACSTGQEAYSIALLFNWYFPELGDWDIRILATDMSPAMIGRAALGEFSRMEVERGLPQAMRTKYFRQLGTHWKIKEEVRDMVDFRVMNLVSAWLPFQSMDLVLLRNILMYFDERTKLEVLRKVQNILRPEGFLVLGGTEVIMDCQPVFRRIAMTKASCYQLCPMSPYSQDQACQGNGKEGRVSLCKEVVP